MAIVTTDQGADHRYGATQSPLLEVVVLHPRDAKALVIPEPNKE